MQGVLYLPQLEFTEKIHDMSAALEVFEDHFLNSFCKWEFGQQFFYLPGLSFTRRVHDFAANQDFFNIILVRYLVISLSIL